MDQARDTSWTALPSCVWVHRRPARLKASISSGSNPYGGRWIYFGSETLIQREVLHG